MKIGIKTIAKNILKILLIGLLSGAIIYLFRFQFINSNAEIKGIVRDKWIDKRETEQGSYAFPKILVESETGEKITIKVDRDLYSRISINSPVRRDKSGAIEIEQ